ncbi:MAG: hypothetical protein C4547_15760 [Phycisphaerales bacterium]|nr:MAG: hypothetical protein C4547_15760 [Phycisphaerales bacterium]
MKPQSLRLALICLAPFIADCAAPGRRIDGARPKDDRDDTLRKLDAFVGRWEVSGMIQKPGSQAPSTLAGRNEVRWEGDLLVARGRTTVDGVDSTAMAVVTYDAAADVYRSVSISPAGSVGLGTMQFDDGESRWRGRIESDGPAGRMIWEGEFRFLDPDTKTERWVGASAEHPDQRIEITKTEKRIP